MVVVVQRERCPDVVVDVTGGGCGERESIGVSNPVNHKGLYKG